MAVNFVAAGQIVGLALLASLSLFAAPRALAQDDDDARAGAKSEPDFFEDKHLFGFTEGSDVGEAGGKEAEFTTTGAFGKKGGGYLSGGPAGSRLRGRGDGSIRL